MGEYPNTVWTKEADGADALDEDQAGITRNTTLPRLWPVST